jgi:hypothetical protein
MPSDEREFAFSSRVPPKALKIKAPYKSWHYQESCYRYMHLTRRVLFKWLNRRSQRKAYTWTAFQQALRHVGWPQVRMRVNLNPFATLNA